MPTPAHEELSSCLQAVGMTSTKRDEMRRGRRASGIAYFQVIIEARRYRNGGCHVALVRRRYLLATPTILSALS